MARWRAAINFRYQGMTEFTVNTRLILVRIGNCQRSRNMNISIMSDKSITNSCPSI
eukprot:UN13304